MTDAALQKYLDQMQGLIDVASESARRIVDEDALFTRHANLFAKSYIITLCSILESYLKEEVQTFIDEVSQVVDRLSLTRNLIVWGIEPGNDELYKKLVGKEISRFRMAIDEKNIDNKLSGDIEKTIKTFRRCGIDITKCGSFQNLKDTVASIVLKRNTVVHHSIQATDFSYHDIIEWSSKVKTYIVGVSDFVNSERGVHTAHLRAIAGPEEMEG